jgi:hypothetical protein
MYFIRSPQPVLLLLTSEKRSEIIPCFGGSAGSLPRT